MRVLGISKGGREGHICQQSIRTTIRIDLDHQPNPIQSRGPGWIGLIVYNYGEDKEQGLGKVLSFLRIGFGLEFDAGKRYTPLRKRF